MDNFKNFLGTSGIDQLDNWNYAKIGAFLGVVKFDINGVNDWRYLSTGEKVSFDDLYEREQYHGYENNGVWQSYWEFGKIFRLFNF